MDNNCDSDLCTFSSENTKGALSNLPHRNSRLEITETEDLLAL